MGLKHMISKKLVLCTIGEGSLILLAGGVGFAAHVPLLFASLGPTAYELVEEPNAPTAKPYNVVAGHLSGLGAGFLSLWIFAAWNAPKVDSAGFVTSPRLWAAVVAVVITTAATLLLKASQPAAAATTLLVSLGTMQTARDAWVIVIGVLIIEVAGEPVRRQFLKLGIRS